MADISGFLQAIRQKDEWYVKILDEQRDLAAKWGQEAGFLPPPNAGRKPTCAASKTDGNYPHAEVVIAALEALKQEARRIIFYDHCIRVTSRQLAPMDVDFGSIKQDVDKELCYIQNVPFAITSPLLKEEVGVFTSNGLVPVALHRELMREMDRLAELNPKDFHPGSDGKVQDLIHPSLYPLVAGASSDDSSRGSPPEFTTTMNRPGHIDTFIYTFASSFSWVPTIFTVSPDETDVHIESYINGLGPRENFPELYRLIEMVFLFALPHLKKTVTQSYNRQKVHDTASSSATRWLERQPFRRNGVTRTKWEELLIEQQFEKYKHEQERKTRYKEMLLHARKERENPELYKPSANKEPSHYPIQYKVIVKAADYLLRPGENYVGSRHMEGMPHERIVASAIYYYDADADIADAGLSLRRLRDVFSDFAFLDLEYSRREDFMVRIINDKPKEGTKSKGGRRRKAKKDSDDSDDSDGEYIPPGTVCVPRREVKEEIDCPSDWEGFDPRYDTSDLSGTIALGTVPTHQEEYFNGTGRIVSFPNWIQHKVEGVSNRNIFYDEEEEPPAARRRILCFFLVDDSDLTSEEIEYPAFTYNNPRHPVPTTADLTVSSMPCLCNKPTLRFVLPVICKRLISKELPPELVELILGFVEFGITWEEAEKYRRELMKERAANVDQLKGISNPMSFSLCEH